MCTFLLALIYLAFISLGLPDSLLGSAWPALRLSFDVPISYMGIVSMIISGGTICSSLLSERLTKRFGTRIVTTVSIFVTAAAMFGFSTVTDFWQLCLW
ncbi:MAG: MFS transporter, partial [Oscillospiraceae bacterium]|nr:MFS transporter [Oscillospiraceae bacterium]